MKVIDIYNYIDSVAPFEKAESWDNVGLLVGDKEAEVTGITVALDLTADTVDFAIKKNANLIVTHHPVIFTAMKSITADSLIYRCIASGINIISAHTSFDVADFGINATLASLLSLENVETFADGIGVIGDIPETEIAAVAEDVKEILGCDAVKVVGEGYISKIAVVGGSGGDFADMAKELGAQLLITGDVKHNVFIDAMNSDFCIIDAGHFYTETHGMKILKTMLQEQFVEIKITEIYDYKVRTV